MLNMTRWTPWTELAGVHRDLDSLFGRAFGDTVRSQSVDSFSPAADLRRCRAFPRTKLTLTSSAGRSGYAVSAPQRRRPSLS
jgi:hypothetical protein